MQTARSIWCSSPQNGAVQVKQQQNMVRKACRFGVNNIAITFTSVTALTLIHKRGRQFKFMLCDVTA